MTRFRFARTALAIHAALALVAAIARPAAAGQWAWVLSQQERTYFAIDVETGRGVPFSGVRTHSSPVDLVVSRDGDVYVAAGDEATIHRETNPGDRIDLHFSTGGYRSEGVALSRAEDTLYVLQTGSLATGSGVLLEVPLGDPVVAGCISAYTKDCYLASTSATLHNLPLTHPRFVATSPTTGVVFAVDATGHVASFDPRTGTSALIPLGAHPAPADPGGLAVSPDGLVAITGNPASGPPVLTLISPGTFLHIETVALPVSEAGGVAFDARRRPDGYPVVVGDANDSAIVEVRWGIPGSRRSTGGRGTHPIDLVVNHRGVVVTVNEDDSVATIFPSHVEKVQGSLESQLVAVALEPPFRDPHVAADPYELYWNYSTFHQWLGARTTMLRNVGEGTLEISKLEILGFDARNFTLVSESCTNTTLAAGDACPVEIDFQAGALSGLRLNDHTYRGRLRVTSNDAPLDLPLTGEHFITALTRNLKVALKPVRRFDGLSLGGGD